MEELNVPDFKEMLEQEKELLEKELSNLGIKNPEDGDWGAILTGITGADRADDNIAADRFEEFGERSAILGELEIRYRNVLNALDKIENGSYGICDVDGEPIELDRLKANPSARTCKKHINQDLK